MFGHTGRLLEVDLSNQTTRVTSIDPTLMEQYVGGSALAARLFFDARGMDADPLSPENPLIVMAGPLTGTTFPGSSRFVMCARSPLTGIWGEAASGGFFGAELKKANLDGIVIWPARNRALPRPAQNRRCPGTRSRRSLRLPRRSC